MTSARGVVAWDIRNGGLHIFHAKAVLLATGGYGRAWKITSNAHANTGDGVALVLEAGLPLEDMEFVQFHPTGLYQARDPPFRGGPRRRGLHRQ